MIQQDSLARLTLDTLPFNIAVLDEEGTILFTNRAWREFAGMGGAESRGDMVGVNYFESMDAGTDEHAAEALAGLQSVIAGERSVFTHEYPCHTPGEKRWFMMRAAELPEHDSGSAVVAHVEITQRKLAEIRAREQREELEHLMNRIDGLVQTVMEAVLQAGTREEIERTVCNRLVDVDPYVCAWVGRVDLRREVLAPAAVADGHDVADEDIALDAADPAARAVATGESQVVGHTDDPALAGVHDSILADRPGSLAAFPLVYNDTEYGALLVYADRPRAFDERELAVLRVLARFASTAINAIEGRRILTTDRVVEVELGLTGCDMLFTDIAAQAGTELVYEGSLYEDGSVAMLFVAEGDDVDAERVVDAAAADDRVERATQVSDGEGRGVFEFVIEEPPIVGPLAERGAETTELVADSQGVELTLELPASAEPRAVVESLSEQYTTELLARRERERHEQTKSELVDDIEGELTSRQELALQKAFLGGFFDWPRTASGEELAASMDITPSTYHQHLRTAERKVLAALFEE
jgi:PAS domain S-box-containing protein